MESPSISSKLAYQRHRRWWPAFVAISLVLAFLVSDWKAQVIAKLGVRDDESSGNEAGQSKERAEEVRWGGVLETLGFPASVRIEVETEVGKDEEKGEDTWGRGVNGGLGPWHEEEVATSLRHVLFGIGSRRSAWLERCHIIRSWWRPGETRGFVWTDEVPAPDNDTALDPKMKASESTVSFPYTNKKGNRDVIRLSRIIVESFRIHIPNVRWFVMCDDDTFFSTDALVAVLAKYDHTLPMLIGSSSETQRANIGHGHQMAFGGAGFAVSWPLAAALNKTLDDCLHRYPELFGSDERVTACSAELGVRLTKELGFHQCDLHGSLEGFLEAHPLQPFVSLHHIHHVDPLFPFHHSRQHSLAHFASAIPADPIGFLQQTVYHHSEGERNWTMNIAWGYSIKVFPGLIRMREMTQAGRTFVSWNYETEPIVYSFDTRHAPDPKLFSALCGLPLVAYVSQVRNLESGHVISTYLRYPPGNRTSCPPGIEQVSTFHVIRRAPLIAPGVSAEKGRIQGPNLRQECVKSMKIFKDNNSNEMAAIVTIGRCYLKEVIAWPTIRGIRRLR